MSRKMENAVRLLEMLIGAVEKNAPRNEELGKMLEQTRKFLATVRKNERVVQKWINKEYPEWKSLTVYFRSTNSNNEQEDDEDFVL